jgi:hypothetical protein
MVMMARLTGLEPATSGVTGRHSNRLSYNRAMATGRCGPDLRLLGAPTGGVKRFAAAISPLLPALEGLTGKPRAGRLVLAQQTGRTECAS